MALPGITGSGLDGVRYGCTLCRSGKTVCWFYRRWTTGPDFFSKFDLLPTPLLMWRHYQLSQQCHVPVNTLFKINSYIPSLSLDPNFAVHFHRVKNRRIIQHRFSHARIQRRPHQHVRLLLIPSRRIHSHQHSSKIHWKPCHIFFKRRQIPMGFSNRTRSKLVHPRLVKNADNNVRRWNADLENWRRQVSS